ncbi:hypothetical protein K402DRAFT_420546 [Aulographum hederae CBS 113979]|uniref:Uncharacterized protein n=1 Tax=Aulographum hederae CBS 113979 TaxID=1176131 RepID=A0A6G1H2P2_9PEZI|nr:hypothetical protein K402DRAFT_420546 [Aulographum hederae CBS 113979]
MSLSLLPSELLILLLEHCVRTRRFSRAYRLRLVNKAFAICTVKAMLQIGTSQRKLKLDKDDSGQSPLISKLFNPKAGWFWQQMLERCVLALRPPSRNALIIRSIAHRILQHQLEPHSTDYTDEDFRACVTKLCHLIIIHEHFQLNRYDYMEPQVAEDPNSLPSSDYFHQQLLSAASFFGFVGMVEDLCHQGFYHTLPRNESIFPDPQACAAYGGHRELVCLFAEKYPEMSPSDPFGGPRNTVVRWAGLAQHDDLVDMALNPRWTNSRANEYTLKYLHGNLLQTRSIDTLRRFLPILKEWTSDPNLRLLPPYPHLHAAKLGEFHSRFLRDRMFSASKCGLKDIVLYLLDEFQVPVDFCPDAQLEQSGRPILDAAMYGHTELVRLFLDRGAIPGYAIEHAATGGFVDTVQLLLEHGGAEETVIRTALERAIWKEHDSVVKLLESSGASLIATEHNEAMKKAKT